VDNTIGPEVTPSNEDERRFAPFNGSSKEIAPKLNPALKNALLFIVYSFF
jgi:hypothetical protein